MSFGYDTHTGENMVTFLRKVSNILQIMYMLLNSPFQISSSLSKKRMCHIKPSIESHASVQLLQGSCT